MYLVNDFKCQRSGFTLIELLCAISIISMIGAICYPNIKAYIRKDRLDLACDTLTGDLRFAKMYAVTRNTTTVRVLFINDNGNGEYSEYLIVRAPTPEVPVMTLKDVKLPDNVYISRYKSTFSRSDSENRLTFYARGNVKPSCTITLVDRETGSEAAITLTIGYTRIMRVNV